MGDIERQLKDAARRSGLSMKALSERSGIWYASIHGFLVNNRQISIGTAARLAEALGLELRPKRRQAKKGR